MIFPGQKNGRLPDSFFHTVNRPTRKMRTGLRVPGPTRAVDENGNFGAGASKDSNFLPSEAPVKSRIRLRIQMPEGLAQRRKGAELKQSKTKT